MVVHELTSEAAFADAHKQAGGKLVVVDFYATWCGPCKVVAPKFAELSEKYARETYCCKLDVDKVREVAQEAGIKSLPSFGFYAQGRLLELQVGGDPLALASKMSALAQKHGSYAFKGQGHSMLGGSSSSGAGVGSAPVATKAIGANAPSAGASSGRRNPWADPNFGLAKAALAKDPAAAPSSAAKPAVAKPAEPAKPVAAAAAPAPAKPVAAAAAPAAKPATAVPAASSERVNPWATKEVPGAAAAATATAAPKPDAASAPSAAAAVPAPAAAAAAPAAGTSGSEAAPAASAAPSTSAAAAPPAANDPALVKNLNSGFLSSLTEMGFSRLRCEKALILTGNKGVDQALNWLMQHENDADIDEPLAVVGSTTASAGGHTASAAELDDMDDDARAIYEEAQRKKLQQRGVSYSGGANEPSAGAGSSGSGKVSTLNMTSEEKMEWLARRRAEVKAAKEAAAIEAIKEAERNRKKSQKESAKSDELREQLQREQADNAIKLKKKEEAEKKAARARVLAKLEEDKQRRREQHQREMEAIAAQKAAAAAAAQKK